MKKIIRKPGGTLDAPEWAVEFLMYGESKSNRWARMDSNDSDFFSDYARTNARELWELYRSDLIEAYAAENHGHRPWGFWRFEPPTEKRKRLGGKGDELSDHTDEKQYYWRGLPEIWIGENWLMSYPELSEFAIDQQDPPSFESEAAYLERLGLLMPGEAERLTPADFEPELILTD